MAIKNVTVQPLQGELSVGWTIATKHGNSIAVGWRLAGSGLSWMKAPQLRLPPTTTSCFITGLQRARYEVLVQQVTSDAGITVASTPLGTRIAVCNLTKNLGNSIGQRLLAAGVREDRLDVLSDGMPRVMAAVAAGIRVVALYNTGNGESGGIQNRTPARVGVEVGAMVQELPPEVTELEVGNEMWLNHEPGFNNDKPDTPQQCATKYAAAWRTVRALGWQGRLIAMVTGDYARPDGTWSSDKSGGGWIRDFVAALPPDVKPDAFSAHPYPPHSVVTAVAHEDNGWPTLATYRSIALSLGLDVPWYVTEVGLRTDEVSVIGQADGWARMLASLHTADAGIPGTPFDWLEYVAVYSAGDDGGPWGLFDNSGAARPSFGVLAAYLASTR